MHPEYAKYLNFTKKIQKAKSTRRADAAPTYPVSRAPATRARRPRVARASRERRDRIPSRAFASHRARAPFFRSCRAFAGEFPRAAPSPARGAFPTVGAGFISIAAVERVAARLRFSFDHPRRVASIDRARVVVALCRDPPGAARSVFAPKSTSRHVGKVRRIYAYRGIDRGFDGVRERFKACDEKVILPLSDPRRGVGCGPCVVVRASSRHRSRERWHSRARARRSTARNDGARDAGAARRTSRRPRTRERWREGAAPRAASEDGDDGDDGDDDGADVRGVSARVRRARDARERRRDGGGEGAV